ncbi:DUF3570 domain-containing protein [bacterium]|nr:DUF3570 domain-containing protein [bacterium]MDB4089153.1 DUF3570 domain-containing protein [Flavobacteriales bacterium]
MKKITLIFLIFLGLNSFTQAVDQDTTKVFKKRVLETAEVNILSSYYSQDGNNASVTGGIGTEKLTDNTPTIKVSIPLNDDDVLTIDAGISAYTSASSSNLDPFDKDEESTSKISSITSPWKESTGASRADTWVNANVNYSQTSEDRNKIWSANVNFATEYDYSSIGFGGDYTRLYNKKNTSLGIKGSVFLDTWRPQTPIELREGKNSTSSYFSNTAILNEDGIAINKNDANAWSPLKKELVSSNNRNSYTVSFSFSQVLSKNAELSLFFDLAAQQGWLSNPMQRVYFKDRPNYYIGNPANIANYEAASNTDIFHLADDIERLPDNRLKLPIGAKLNYYINEYVVAKTFIRYYTDNWGVTSQTAQIILPIKVSGKFTLYPAYRFYNQTAADYFAGYNEHSSTDTYYTSDYDLSKFNSNQYSIGIKYSDVLSDFNIWKFELKNIQLKYSYYKRSNGLTANMISFSTKFALDKIYTFKKKVK